MSTAITANREPLAQEEIYKTEIAATVLSLSAICITITYVARWLDPKRLESHAFIYAIFLVIDIFFPIYIIVKLVELFSPGHLGPLVAGTFGIALYCSIFAQSFISSGVAPFKSIRHVYYYFGVAFIVECKVSCIQCLLDQMVAFSSGQGDQRQT